MNLIMYLGLLLMIPFIIFVIIYSVEWLVGCVKTFARLSFAEQAAALIVISFIIGLILYIYSIVELV